MKPAVFLVAGLAAVVTLCSCSSARDLQLAGQALVRFHRQFTAGKDAAIYASADPAYRKAISEQANRNLFEKIRERLGPCHGSRLTFERINWNTSGTFVTLDDTWNCTRGKLQEGFVWHVSEGRTLLYNYHFAIPLSAQKTRPHGAHSRRGVSLGRRGQGKLARKSASVVIP